MSFMLPQIVSFADVAEFIELDLDDSSTYSHAWRLSAPGYLDCTDWIPATSLAAAVSDMLGTYGDEFDREALEELGTYVEGFAEFLTGYLTGLAFTGSIESEESNNDEPIYSNPGDDIRDVVDVVELFGELSEETQLTILSDCLSFLVDAFEYLGDSPDYAHAGSDFHLTRNHHGAGFWDGAWEHGDKLTELSKPYGTAELIKTGDCLAIRN